MKMIRKILPITSLAIMTLSSCFKDIDIDEERVHIDLNPNETFYVENSIQHYQSFFKFTELEVIEISTNDDAEWDLAFEASTEGFKVIPNYGLAAKSYHTNFGSVDDITTDYVVGINDASLWDFDDPAYSTRQDSLYFSNWEIGKVSLLKRGVSDNNYIALKLIEKNTEHYKFEYKSLTNPEFRGTKIIEKTDDLSYVYFSFKTEGIVDIEPLKNEWHIVAAPYFGWYETNTPGEYQPYRQSGFLINNEAGVEVAQIFDENINYDDINDSSIETSEFTDFKGAIGSNWKLLGSTTSTDIYSMDENKKYIVKTFDEADDKYKYYKLQIIYYKNSEGDFHYPTVKFKFIGER